jgi:flagellin
MYVSWDPSSAQALNSLAAAQSSLQKTQSQLSTGKSVNDSSENAALWAMATANYSQSGALAAMTTSQQSTAMPLASSTESAIGAISGVLDAMQNNLIALQGDGDQTATLQSLQSQGQQLQSAVNSAGLAGVNLLDGSTAPTGATFMTSYAEWGGGGQNSSVNVPAASLTDTTGTGAFQTAQAAGSTAPTDLTAITASDVSAANISQTLANLNAAQTQLQSVAGAIGAFSNIMDQSNAAATTEQVNIANATAGMDNADMGAVATLLAAGQVQQQLATLAASIANQSHKSVLQLFQQNAA